MKGLEISVLWKGMINVKILLKIFYAFSNIWVITVSLVQINLKCSSRYAKAHNLDTTYISFFTRNMKIRVFPHFGRSSFTTNLKIIFLLYRDSLHRIWHNLLDLYKDLFHSHVIITQVKNICTNMNDGCFCTTVHGELLVSHPENVR